jgi:hypothetical protein
MIYWCLILVTLSQNGAYTSVETAVKGIVLQSTETVLTLDISEYSEVKGYLTPRVIKVDKEFCVNSQNIN